MTVEKNKSNWSAIRAQLKGWSRPAVMALLKDLYDASAANRDFIHARFQAEDDGGEALERYREKIIEPFFPKRGFGKLKLADARKAIRDYSKATGNLAGTIELMLTYVEQGTAFTLQYGDIDGPFYNSMEAMLGDLANLLRRDGATLYPLFRERIQQLGADTRSIGWGYGDSVGDLVATLECELGGAGES